MKEDSQSVAVPPGPDAGDEGVRLAVRGSAGIVSLDRPAAGNAFTDAMRHAMTPAYERWAGDPAIYAVIIESTSPGIFCAGGDLHEMAQLQADPARARRSSAEEYTHNWRLDRFPRPHVALIDGYHAGAGVGLTLYGTHRVAGEGYRFAMPEVSVGFFPDIGASHALARLPHAIGLYLALTGRAIKRADAHRLGLATHCIGAADYETIKARLADADPVDQILDALHESAGPGELVAAEGLIADSFGEANVVAILRKLELTTGAMAEWAQATARELRAKSPFSLCLTFAQVRQAAQLSLKEVLEIDYRIAGRMLFRPDLAEGVRALLIDKDRRPRWMPAAIEDVDGDEVARCFTPLLEDPGFRLPDFGGLPGPISDRD